jgi:pyruvate,water dikinase
VSKFVLDWPEAAQAGPAGAGGKGWQLGLLAGFGVPIPPGFVIQAAPVAERNRGEALPAAQVKALANELARRDWADLPLAVRSSAAAEDSAAGSFAGIFRSHLNVLGLDALVVAVQDVLDSGGDLAALAYRERMGLGDTGNSMAVVIMPLLPAVASGVAFTIDPITGREDQMVIHANWGLGEALVVGQTDGDEYRLQRDFPQPDWSLVEQRPGAKTRMSVAAAEGGTKLQELSPELASQSVLTASQATTLGKLVHDVATALDYTQPYYDVEWVWDGRSFWILQARPITARSRQSYPALANQPMLWSRGNSRDVAPDPFPALDWSLSGPLIKHMLTRTATLAGYPLLPGLQRTTLHQGRLYFETAVLQWEAFDAFDVAPKSYNRLIGGHQPDIRVPSRMLGQRLLRAWRGTRFLLNIIGPRLRARSTLARAHQQAQQQLALPVPASLKESADLLRVQIARMRGAEDLMLLQASGSALALLLNLLDHYFPNEGSTVAAALLSGGAPSITAAQSYELMQLAVCAAADAPALAWLTSTQRVGQQWDSQLPENSSFRLAFKGFLRRYGHRAVYESYLHQPRWREKPDYLLDNVLSLIGCDAKALTERQRNVRDAARMRIRQRLPVWHRWLVHWLVKLATSERNVREAARSALIAHSGVVRRLVLNLAEQLSSVRIFVNPEHAFHLALEELLALAEGDLAGTAATERASWRRSQYEEFTRREVPEVVMQARGATSLNAAQVPASVVDATGDEWRGQVVSAGHAQGVAFLATHPNATLDMPVGAILVAPATDPSWTPAFLKAAAIVMETGGYLSHGAIVAREFGIPAVVNLPGILSALSSGDQLEVDATRGVVQRLHAPDGEH